jgi:hypothetical protein
MLIHIKKAAAGKCFIGLINWAQQQATGGIIYYLFIGTFTLLLGKATLVTNQSVTISSEVYHETAQA